MISLSSRPYLFVDETLVARHDGTALRLHSPRRENVACVFDAPWEGPDSNYCSVTTIGGGTSDPPYRLYYRGMSGGTDLQHEASCVAESEDGITFRRRFAWQHYVGGSAANNIIWLGERDVSHNMCPFWDPNPNAPADARFKAIGGVSRQGVHALASADGIRWRLLSEKPVMTEGDFDSLNVAFWDSVVGCYSAYIRQSREGKRSIRRCRSADFVHWTAPEWLDFGEGPLEHFYTNAIQPYPRDPALYLGFPMRFVPERTRHRSFGEPGVSDSVLIASRDGLRFPHRWREAFIRPGLDQRNWTHRNFITAPGLIATSPTEYSLYWVEHYAHHDCRLVRGVVRLDGFASLHAGWQGGEMTSVAVRLAGERVVLNVSTSAPGGARVEVQDVSGRPIPGWTMEACDEVFGDDIARVVTWNGSPSLGRLRGEAVRLRFSLHDADVFSVACVGESD